MNYNLVGLFGVVLLVLGVENEERRLVVLNPCIDNKCTADTLTAKPSSALLRSGETPQ